MNLLSIGDGATYEGEINAAVAYVTSGMAKIYIVLDSEQHGTCSMDNTVHGA
jgi:hypothetical protein